MNTIRNYIRKHTPQKPENQVGMIKLHTETTIDSSHYLNDYDGKCRNLHGHTWFIEIWIMGFPNDCDETGILFDFGSVKEIKEELDHKVLNDLKPFEVVNPTAENLSMWLYDKLKYRHSNLFFKIRLYETKVGKETYCEYGDF